jgi:phosphoglycerol transferase
VTAGYLTYNFRLHHADFTAPLCPAHNDSAALLSLVKCIQESDWPWRAKRLGAPGVAERYDYPLPEHAHYLTIRLLLQITDNPFLAFNVWCLLSYPVTAVCAFAVLRVLGLSRPIGFALAIVYTFLPYHAGRVFTHTMLAFYHTVPLIVLPAAWIAMGRLPFFRPSDPPVSGGGQGGGFSAAAYSLTPPSLPPVQFAGEFRQRFWPFTATTFSTLILSAVVAATSPYYAFFGCFFLLIAGLYRGLSEGSWRPIFSGVATAAFVSAVGFACALPFVLEQREHGANPAVAQRHPNEADVYSLKLTKLVLPFGGHRVAAIGHVTRLYNSESLNDNENRDGVLGLVGVAGFAILLGRLLVARSGPTLLGGLAILNVSALVLGASGGLGGLFNFLVFPQIRCYNRVSIFIAFWCLLAVGLLVDRWAARGHHRRAWLAAAAILVLGLFDITSQRQAPHHSELKRNHAAWAGFVERMENALPPGAMVFQLPATSYPEAGTTHRMPDYAHLACHSYSRKLRWSYGTNRNRRWAEWQQHVASLTLSQMVRALCLAGFDGLYVDRRGYPDGGKCLLAELRALLGTELVVSDTGEQMLFSLAPAAQTIRSSLDARSLERERRRLLDRPCVLCQDGFLRWAPVSPPEPRRATHAATMRLINPGKERRRVTLSILWQRHTAHEIDVHVTCVALGVDRHECPPVERGAFALELDLPPGEHVLRFDSNPKPMGLPRMYTAWNATEVRLDTE